MAMSQRVGTDYCTYTSQGKQRQHIPFSRHYTTWALQGDTHKSHIGQRRPSGKSPEAGRPGNSEERQPMQAALADNPFGERYLRGNVNVQRMTRLETYESYISEHLFYLPPINLCKY